MLSLYTTSKHITTEKYKDMMSLLPYILPIIPLSKTTTHIYLTCAINIHP